VYHFLFEAARLALNCLSMLKPGVIQALAIHSVDQEPGKQTFLTQQRQSSMSKRETSSVYLFARVYHRSITRQLR